MIAWKTYLLLLETVGGIEINNRELQAKERCAIRRIVWKTLLLRSEGENRSHGSQLIIISLHSKSFISNNGMNRCGFVFIFFIFFQKKKRSLSFS